MGVARAPARAKEKLEWFHTAFWMPSSPDDGAFLLVSLQGDDTSVIKPRICIPSPKQCGGEDHAFFMPVCVRECVLKLYRILEVLTDCSTLCEVADEN